jgi:hypothetical protein
MNTRHLPARSIVANLTFAFAMMSVSWALQGQSTGENLLKNGGAEAGDVSGWNNIPSTSDTAQDGKKSFVLATNKTVLSDAFIEVDPKARYDLSAYFMAPNGTAKCYLGFECYDADKKRIASQEISTLKGTETTLSEAAVKGDKVLKIGNGKSWVYDESWTPQYGCVAINVDDSGACSDLPNRNLTDFGIAAIRQSGAKWEVELVKPLTMDIPAGTKVREHRAQGNCRWVGNRIVSGQWEQLNGIVSGIATTGQEPGKFFPGTRYIKVNILNLDYNADALVDNVVLRKLE